MVATLDCDGGDRNECAPHLLGEPRMPGALEAQLELLVIRLTRTDRRERLDSDLCVVEALCEFERASSPGDCLLRMQGGRTAKS
jgi:hypothetical protein